MNKDTIQKAIPGAKLAWLITALYLLYQVLLQTSPSVMVPQLIQSFNTNAVGVSMISSTYFYSYIALQIPAGLLIDRFSIRRLVTASLIAMALSCILFAYSQSFAAAIIARIMMGAVAGTALVSVLSIAGRWFPLHYFTLLVGLTETLGVLGGATGQLVLSQSVMHVGWSYTMYACAIVGLVLAAVSFLYIPEPKLSLSSTDDITTISAIDCLKKLFSMSRMWLLGIHLGILYSILIGFAGLWLIPMLQFVYGLSLTTASTLSATVFIGAATGAPLIGILAQKTGKYQAILSIGTIACVPLSSLLIWLPFTSLPCLLVLCFSLGLFSGAYVIPFVLAKESVDSRMQGATMGFMNMLCVLIGAPILQPLIGSLIHLFGDDSILSYRLALSIMPLLIIVAFMITYFLDHHEAEAAT